MEYRQGDNIKGSQMCKPGYKFNTRINKCIPNSAYVDSEGVVRMAYPYGGGDAPSPAPSPEPTPEPVPEPAPEEKRATAKSKAKVRSSAQAAAPSSTPAL